MTLGIDARVLTHRPTGVARYLRGLLEEFPALRAPGETIELFVDASPSEPLPGQPDRVTVLRWPGPGGDPAWRQARLAWRLRRSPVDVLFCPFYSAPLSAPEPWVVTVHDVSFLAHPEWFRLRSRLAFSLVGPSARRAARVITVSRFSADEIVRRLQVPASRIEVIPIGLDPSWRALVTTSERRAVREWLGHTGPYVLHLGAVHQRRNVDALLRASALLAPTNPDLAVVVAGPTIAPAPNLARLTRELGLERRVLRREWAPENLVRALLAEAAAVVYLSSYEGFGLPALEALAVGAPLIALRRASLPEVLGDAALWLDEPTADGLAFRIQTILDDPRAAGELGRRGAAHAARFSRADGARRTFDLLRAQVR